MQISDLSKFVGKEVELKGWVYRQRSSAKVAFVILRDPSGIVQCTSKDSDGFFKKAESVSIESSVSLKGIVKKDERAPGGYELALTDFEIIHAAERFPIVKDQSTEFLLDVRHLWLRSIYLTDILKVFAAALRAAREYFYKVGYTETKPPVITPNACEGGTTLFEIDYFGEKRYLSQSAQMYLEALIFSLGKVYSLTPSMRAEKSRTPRHLCEYQHLEAEAAFTDFEGILELEEGLVESMCHEVAKQCPEELKRLGREPKDLLAIKAPFRRIPYDDVLKMLEKKGIKLKWGEDLSSQDEAVLMKDEKQPFFLTKPPMSIKPFYVMADPKNPKVALSADLLAPEGIGEITTGGQRCEDIAHMIKELKKEGIPIKNYEWYLDLRRYGSVPHSGFGLGMERFVRWICKLEHIRDVPPFPRTPVRSYP